MSNEELLTRLDQLEQALFGGKVEERFFEEETTPKILFDDALEKTIFFILFDIALEGRIGATSVLVAEMTDKTKNTVNVRLERLYYKQLIQKQQIGNALLYYIPLYELLLRAITKELVQLQREQGDIPPDTSVEEAEKRAITKYLTDVQVLFEGSQEYFASLSKKVGYTKLNLKKELLK